MRADILTQVYLIDVKSSSVKIKLSYSFLIVVNSWLILATSFSSFNKFSLFFVCQCLHSNLQVQQTELLLEHFLRKEMGKVLQIFMLHVPIVLNWLLSFCFIMIPHVALWGPSCYSVESCPIATWFCHVVLGRRACLMGLHGK